MANTDSPKGFEPRRQVNSAAFNSANDGYRIASGYNTTIYKGDRVKLVAGKIQKAGVTEAAMGVFYGCKFDRDNDDPYIGAVWTANTATKGAVDAEALVVDDLEDLFCAQFTNSTSVPTQADVGKYYNAFDAGGSALWQISGQGVDYSTGTVTAANGMLRFERFEEQPDNDTTAAYSKGLFRFSNGAA